MEISEYKNIFDVEESHFFYVGTHNLIINLLKLYVLPKHKRYSKTQLKILDAGCGTGLLLQKLQSYGQVTGVDISCEAIKHAKKRGLKEVYHSSVERIPLKNNSFDVIVCIDVLYHRQVRSDIKALKEFYRLLKPGGVVIIKAPSFNWLSGKHDQLVQTARRYNKSKLNDKLVKANFKIKKISYSNMFLLPTVFLKRRLENYFSFYLSGPSDVFQLPFFLNKSLILILKLENCLIERLNLPIGVSVIAVAEKPME